MLPYFRPFVLDADYRTEKSPTPNVTLPEAFQSPSSSDARNNEPWWKTFDSPELNDLMGVALEKNLDVKQSWNRLAQASAVYVINRAGQLPALRINSGASITQTTDRKPLSASQQFIDIAESLGVPVIDGDLTTENIIVGGGLSYELDIWRRVNSLKASARSNLSATFEDVQATAFLVSASVVDAWLSRQQVELLKLVREQLSANRTQLELLELRLSVGQATALDVAATPTSCRHRSRDSIDGIRIGYATTSTSDSVGPKSNARARVNQRSGPS